MERALTMPVMPVEQKSMSPQDIADMRKVTGMLFLKLVRAYFTKYGAKLVCEQIEAMMMETTNKMWVGGLGFVTQQEMDSMGVIRKGEHGFAILCEEEAGKDGVVNIPRRFNRYNEIKKVNAEHPMQKEIIKDGSVEWDEVINQFGAHV